MKLFYIILGATPKSRNTEQHDVFFGIAENLRDLVPAIKDFWPEAEGRIHIDCYQEVRFVNGFEITVTERSDNLSDNHLFFVNLGGYQHGFFGELHEQHLIVAPSLSAAVKKVKQTGFYRTMGFQNAASHIDDRYGVDIDDVFKVNDLLPASVKEKYTLRIEKSVEVNQKNFTHIGYLKIDKIK